MSLILDVIEHVLLHGDMPTSLALQDLIKDLARILPLEKYKALGMALTALAGFINTFIHLEGGTLPEKVAIKFLDAYISVLEESLNEILE